MVSGRSSRGVARSVAGAIIERAGLAIMVHFWLQDKKYTLFLEKYGNLLQNTVGYTSTGLRTAVSDVFEALMPS